jgi:hypothetical protein
MNFAAIGIFSSSKNDAPELIPGKKRDLRVHSTGCARRTAALRKKAAQELVLNWACGDETSGPVK